MEWATGFEPAHLSTREPKSRMFANYITPTYYRRYTAGLMKASVRIKRTWQRRIESNYRIRSQSPLHYRYATALYKSSRAEFKAIPGYVKKGGGLSTITGRRIIFLLLDVEQATSADLAFPVWKTGVLAVELRLHWSEWSGSN